MFEHPRRRREGTQANLQHLQEDQNPGAREEDGREEVVESGNEVYQEADRSRPHSTKTPSEGRFPRSRQALRKLNL